MNVNFSFTSLFILVMQQEKSEKNVGKVRVHVYSV